MTPWGLLELLRSTRAPEKEPCYSDEKDDRSYHQANLRQELDSHLAPPWPVVPRAIPPHIQIVRDSLLVHDI